MPSQALIRTYLERGIWPNTKKGGVPPPLPTHNEDNVACLLTPLLISQTTPNCMSLSASLEESFLKSPWGGHFNLQRCFVEV
jgi:hypothetical protein